MLFHSIEFLFVFLPITWLVFYFLIRSNCLKAACAWLSVTSLAFYSWWNPAYAILITASILVNFLIGKLLHQEGPIRDPKRRTAILSLGIFLNLGTLGYFKYANFFVDNFNLLLGTSYNLERIILPLAISFFTFQQIVYIVDAHRSGDRRYSFREYSFFVLFFPQLIAGPIVHHDEIVPQLSSSHWKPLRLENFQVGIAIFVIGLYKKMVLADGSAAYAGPLFNVVENGGVLSAEDAWIAAFAYAFQLYFDFSGYSDMAIGLARLFGIQLPLNFNSPYQASSIIEFWRRWHITLSRFLREFVYIPLGGNRKGIYLRYSNLLITMLVGGLWHGAGWNFIIWGGLHGCCLIANHLFRDFTRPFFEKSPAARKVFSPFGWLLTMFAVVVSWVFFRAESFQAASSMLRSLFLFHDIPPTRLPPDIKDLISGKFVVYWLVIVGAIAVLAPSTQKYLRNYNPTLEGAPLAGKRTPAWRPTLGHGIFIGVLILFTIRRYFSLSPTEFIYFNF